MAFSTLEYLKEGNVDFVYRLSTYDKDNLIALVRESKNRIEIINGFLPKLKFKSPTFCFLVIYDIPEFMDDAIKLFDLKLIDPEKLKNLLYNSPLGLKVLNDNFDYFLLNDKDSKNFEVVVKYAFDANNQELLHQLSRYHNLHIRYLFMDYLIDNHLDKINEIYDDITKYTTSFTHEPGEQMVLFAEQMDVHDISKLAVKLLNNDYYQEFDKLKELILATYQYNSLASEILGPVFVNNSSDLDKEERNRKIFDKDADILFKTSMNYRFHILFDEKVHVSKELLNEFAFKMHYYLYPPRIDEYKINITQDVLKQMDWRSLTPLLEEWTEKYMDLSHSREYGFIGAGTTCSCYRIGDYVFKLVKTKWSYEDVICPNLYLFAKNYEEKYVRDKYGIVRGGIEVQKYLTKKANDIDPKYYRLFDDALEGFGYTRTDTLVNGTYGDNTMLLDTYLDADSPNPERLPDWFKECPIVIVDRDRIYEKGAMFIKQLKGGY